MKIVAGDGDGGNHKGSKAREDSWSDIVIIIIIIMSHESLGQCHYRVIMIIVIIMIIMIMNHHIS